MGDVTLQQLLQVPMLQRCLTETPSLVAVPNHSFLLHCRQTLPRGALESGSSDWDQFKSRSG